VVATPHFYARCEDPQRFLQRREQAEQKLRAAMAEQSDMPELLMGAEVYYFRGIAESEILPQLTIRGTNSILVELPSGRWDDGICRDLTDIWEKRGLTPIVAHMDRYIRPFHTHGIPKLLQQLPVLVQANAEFFLDRTTAGMALRLLKADQIQLLGSDCHNLTDRKPNLAQAIQRIEAKLGRGPIEKLLHYETRALSARQQGTE
jgi:protein-tyrosine phosphatase